MLPAALLLRKSALVLYLAVALHHLSLFHPQRLLSRQAYIVDIGKKLGRGKETLSEISESWVDRSECCRCSHEHCPYLLFAALFLPAISVAGISQFSLTFYRRYITAQLAVACRRGIEEPSPDGRQDVDFDVLHVATLPVPPVAGVADVRQTCNVERIQRVLGVSFEMDLGSLFPASTTAKL